MTSVAVLPITCFFGIFQTLNPGHDLAQVEVPVNAIV